MKRVPKNPPPSPHPALATLPALAQRLQEELADLEARLEEKRKALEALSPLPVHWKPVRCGKESCTRCPHGPYPYLRVKREGKWRWKYLGKGWQPPEGFTRPREFLELLREYRRLLRRREEPSRSLRAVDGCPGGAALARPPLTAKSSAPPHPTRAVQEG